MRVRLVLLFFLPADILVFFLVNLLWLAGLLDPVEIFPCESLVANVNDFYEG
jgi:hypothetical protein